ncbi:hypothetical protein KUTeg_011786 [Tegillarca granosa]|uniref:Nuclease HARBI1 n=1 Tax=Tegillarca granosa TaxID=220873 RepID=A0ABQ9EXN1_TEGGR|nr:hypothetical protein KUTeg_011786 [Tegillarca granosa]
MVIIIARLRRRRAVLRRQKSFKCVLNPLNGLTDGDIFCRYRFRRETTIFLVTLLSPAIQYHTSRSMAVPPLIQILATLRFLATGSFYRLVGDSLGLSIASVARSVDRVTSAVCRLSRTYIKFPTGQYLSDTKKKFFELAGFPQVAGCIDGTFIRIIAPSENEQNYMICDANYRITNCVAKWPDSVHDSRMFKHSHLCQKFEYES